MVNMSEVIQGRPPESAFSAALPQAIPPQSVDSQPISSTNSQATASTRLLTLNQLRQEYPCSGCNAPCCSYLPLHTFNVSNIRELDHALYLLNFPQIELGISATGEWGVYYRYPCRFLDRDAHQCSIYQDKLRPSICAHYSPYSCWYKRVLGPTAHESYLRIDRRRMQALSEQLLFDQDHNLVSIPDWSTMRSMFEQLPIDEEFDADFEDDAVFERWLYQAAYGSSEEPTLAAQYSYTSLLNPCNNCGAFCCKYLIFPQSVPATRVSLDYLQFVLGFPGLELGVSDSSWFVIVQARCRHLSENKCSIYGQPERPQICTFYDAHGCQYVAQFGIPRPESFMRVKLEQFYWLVEPIGFDQFGNITLMPGVEELRQHVERQWHQTVLSQADQAEGAGGI
jgi:Fe-S-cluster containining protein